MPGVKIIVRNNEGDLIELARYLNRTGWEVVQRAEEGSVGISTIFMDDLDQSVWDTLGLNVGARRQIRLVDITTNKIVQFGYTARRSIKRRYDVYGSPVGRAWSIEIWDPNTVINRRVLTHKHANRPRETDVERIQWLTESAPEWDIVDQFIIGTDHPKVMSKSDYRKRMVNELIADCAQQARKNYWLDIVDDGDGDRLTFWYGRDTRDYYASELSISNDLTDWDIPALNAGTTTDVYPPSSETEYQMQPDRIFTGVGIEWEKGFVYRHSITGATQFERWDTVMQAPHVHEKDRAIERALNMLERFADEDVRIESAILVPAADAHRIRAGMRIPVKLTHIPEMTEYVDCRILSRGLSPRADGAMYWIPLTLEPIEPTTPATCSASLASVVTSTTTDITSDESVSASITPTAGIDSAVIVGFLVRNRFTPDAHDASLSTGTEVYAESTHNTSPFEHPTWAVGYDNVVAASGPYTADATYDGHDDNGIAWVFASFATSETAPVQEAHNKFSTPSPGTVTLGSPVTAGNMLVMVVTVRDRDPYPIGQLFPSTGWTELVSESADPSDGASHDSIGIYARCADTGDGQQYGLSSNNSKSHSVTVMEWAVT